MSDTSIPTETVLAPGGRDARPEQASGTQPERDLEAMEEAVREAIEAIRPALQADGGDITFEYVDDDGVVHVSLLGACGTCPVSTMTLKAGVERIIMDRVPGVTEVVADE